MTSINQFDDAALKGVLKNPVGNRRRQPSLKEKIVDLTCRVLRRLVSLRAYRLLILEQDDISDRFNRENCRFAARLIRGDEL